MNHLRLAGLSALAAAVTTPSFGQAVLAQPPRFDSAPWWMDQPIIASTGYVEAHILANRANFSASFQAVAKAAPDATKTAADKVRALGTALSAYGSDKVRVETTFSMRPIYEQYRDKDGNLIANQRADKIDSYEVDANVAVEIRDVSLVERVYATVLAAQPTSTRSVDFSLEADNETKTQVYAQAVADAARRAKLSTEATGVKLGAVKLIDPTGRACQTDVLVAGAPSDGPPTLEPVAVDVPSPMVAVAAPAPPPTSSAGQQLRPQDMQLPLQPPLQDLSETVCVVYALG